MPIGEFEREILLLIARNRNPDSFIGGATVLHQSAASPRVSRDVDIFHDTTESLASSVEADTAVLRAAGYEVDLGREQETFRRAIVRRAGRGTKLEWVFDSAFRFFPIEADAEVGWRLNFWDAATNKALALFGRHEFRDFVDIHYLHHHHLQFGALVWAASGKDGGLTPQMILEWTRRQAFYTPEQVKEVQVSPPLDLVQMRRDWMGMAAEAEALFDKLPPAERGCLYLNSEGKPVWPDPASPEFAKLIRHYGSVRGAWPQIVE
jgi:hypothetical protein